VEQFIFDNPSAATPTKLFRIGRESAPIQLSTTIIPSDTLLFTFDSS